MKGRGRSFAAPHLFRAANIRIKFCVFHIRKDSRPLRLLMNLAEFIEGQRDHHLAELCEFLRIPSVSAKSEHKPDIERGARWVADHLRAAGFKKVEIIPTPLHPLVYAESLEAPGKPTILFYGHYDVQPAEPLDLWTTPAFDPTFRTGNLFGRGTPDGKSQVHIPLTPLQTLPKLHPHI